MASQIVEITSPRQILRKSYGFLEVCAGSEKIGKVALDDILTVVISTVGCTVSTVLIDELCKRNIPIVICGKNYLPCNITMPVEGYSKQYHVMTSQVNLKLPRKKRAWQRIVRCKIQNQSKVLSYIGANNIQLDRLAKNVQSGDKGNCEALAARLYWQNLFGTQFRRRQSASGINSALNYAYTIVRACTARGIVGAGLHPTFGIHHKNPRNAFNLVEDLMEPFRPIVDYLIWRNLDECSEELRSETKTKLAAITNIKVCLLDDDRLNVQSPLSLAMVKFSKSYADYCQGDRDCILLPDLPKPIEYPGF